jgi:hypothetical protein
MLQLTIAIVGAGVSGTSLSHWLQVSSRVPRHGPGRRQAAGRDGHRQWSKSSPDWASCQQDGSPDMDPGKTESSAKQQFEVNNSFFSAHIALC